MLYLGLAIGIFTLVIHNTDFSCFGASTPIDIKVTNQTNRELKIYTISFWDDFSGKPQNFTAFREVLNPKQATTICMDNDSCNFWLVAKNGSDKVVYLNQVTDNSSMFSFEIRGESTALEKGNTHLALKLTADADQSRQLEQLSKWLNVVFGCLICFVFFRNKLKINGSHR